jgi:hypothetical protein
MRIVRFILVALAFFAAPARAQQSISWQETTTLGFNADNSKLPIVVFNRTNNGTGFVHGICSATNSSGVCTSYTSGSCPGFDNSPNAFQPCNFPPGVWLDIPLAQFGVPSGVKAVFLQGLLVISPSNTSTSTPDLWAQCRAPGSTLAAGNYQMQTIGENQSLNGVGGVGARSTVAMWCPVANDQIELYWSHSTSGGTDDSSYLVNLTLQAYSR